MIIPYFSIVLSGCLWGCTGVVYKFLQPYAITSVQAATYRQLIASLLVGGFLLVSKRDSFRITFRKLVPLILAGGVGSGIYNLTYFMAVFETSVSFASALSYTAPAFVTVLSLLFFHEKLSFQKGLALCLSVVGCVLVTGVLQNTGVHYSAHGILLGLIAGFSYSLYSVFLKMAILKGCSTETASFYCLFFAFLVVAPFSHLTKTFPMLAAKPLCIPVVLILGVFCAAIPSLSYSWGMTHVESSKAAMIATVDLVVATVLGVVLFHDPLTASQLFGVMLIFSSVLLLAYKKEKKHDL